jgi:predicted 3-demethylubiquinone-9 3-methyltransferase (glyoxalase superfamily)
MLFTQKADGKAEEATEYYLSVFKDAKRGAIARYPEGTPNKPGNVMFTDFMLEGQWFVAMDGGPMHKYTFNEAVSFMVNCDTQEEIDYYWSKLSHVPESEQCGWCKDRYGVSWQIIPSNLEAMMGKGTPEQAKRVTDAFMQMKKFDLAAVERAYTGK